MPGAPPPTRQRSRSRGSDSTDAGSLWRCEGPNEKESATNMRLGGKWPQMTRQLELPLVQR